MKNTLICKHLNTHYFRIKKKVSYEDCSGILHRLSETEKLNVLFIVSSCSKIRMETHPTYLHHILNQSYIVSLGKSQDVDSKDIAFTTSIPLFIKSEIKINPPNKVTQK